MDANRRFQLPVRQQAGAPIGGERLLQQWKHARVQRVVGQPAQFKTSAAQSCHPAAAG